MLKQLFFVLFIVFGSLAVQAQQYPIYVLPGQSTLVEPKADTLWVLTDGQLKKAILAKKMQSILNEQITEYKKQNELYKLKCKEQKELVDTLEVDRNFYMQKWEESEQAVEKTAKKLKRQKLYTRLSLIGMAVTFVIGFFVGK